MSACICVCMCVRGCGTTARLSTVTGSSHGPGLAHNYNYFMRCPQSTVVGYSPIQNAWHHGRRATDSQEVSRIAHARSGRGRVPFPRVVHETI